MHASMPYFEFVISQKHHGSFNVTKTNGMLTPSLPESSLCAHVMGPDYILHGSVFFFVFFFLIQTSATSLELYMLVFFNYYF